MKFVFVKRDELSLPDGISQFVFAVSDALLRLGHDVTCVTTHDADLEQVHSTYDFERYPRLGVLASPPAPRLGRLRVLWRKSRLWAWNGRRWMEREQPDLIVLNGALPVRFRQPSALIAHDLEPRSLGGDLGRKIYKTLTYRLVRRLIVTCPELAAPVGRESLLPPDRFQVIPTCLDVSRYAPVRRNERARNILHVGMHEYKQADKTIAAFARLRVPDARLVVVGKMAPRVATQIANLPASVRARVETPGIVSSAQLKDLLASAMVVSVPSHYAQPVASPTVLEAIASHTPPVVSQSISTIVARDGLNCLVAASVDAMVTAFETLLQDADAWERIAAGCASTKPRFDSLTVANEYVQLARELAAATARKPAAAGSRA